MRPHVARFQAAIPAGRERSLGGSHDPGLHIHRLKFLNRWGARLGCAQAWPSESGQAERRLATRLPKPYAHLPHSCRASWLRVGVSPSYQKHAQVCASRCKAADASR